jgi:hypothetical protein
MGGYSAKCAYCGKQYLRASQLHAHKRGAHNVGGHKGGYPDQQDMSQPWSGKLLPGVQFYGPPEYYGPPYPSYVVWEACVDRVDPELEVAHMTMYAVAPPSALAINPGKLWAVFPLSYYPAPPLAGMLYHVRADLDGGEGVTVTPMPVPPDAVNQGKVLADLLRMAKELRQDAE